MVQRSLTLALFRAAWTAPFRRAGAACCVLFLALIALPAWAKQPVSLDLKLAADTFRSTPEIVLQLILRNTSRMGESVCVPPTLRDWKLVVIDLSTNKPYQPPSDVNPSSATESNHNPLVQFRTILPPGERKPTELTQSPYPLESPWSHPACRATGDASDPTDITENQDPSNYLGFRLDPNDVWETTLPIGGQLLTPYWGIPYLAPGKYRVSVSFNTRGEVVTSPEREFTLLTQKPNEESFRAAVLQSVADGEAYLRDYPDGIYLAQVSLKTLLLAREAEDWAAMARVGEKLFKSPHGKLGLFERKLAGQHWAKGLWKSGKKKEAEDLLAREDLLEGWTILSSLRTTDRWPGPEPKKRPAGSTSPAYESPFAP